VPRTWRYSGARYGCEDGADCKRRTAGFPRTKMVVEESLMDRVDGNFMEMIPRKGFQTLSGLLRFPATRSKSSTRNTAD
jgi:hypothetical protein